MNNVQNSNLLKSIPISCISLQKTSYHLPNETLVIDYYDYYNVFLDRVNSFAPLLLGFENLASWINQNDTSFTPTLKKDWSSYYYYAPGPCFFWFSKNEHFVTLPNHLPQNPSLHQYLYVDQILRTSLVLMDFWHP